MTYRKKKDREFFMIDGETVTRVLNKHYGSLIETTKNAIVMNAANDPYESTVSNEDEFTRAYNEAMEVIRKV